MALSPATPLQSLGAEVLVVQVLGHLLQVLHVGAVEEGGEGQRVSQSAAENGTGLIGVKRALIVGLPLAMSFS